jgi:hypothetical protein
MKTEPFVTAANRDARNPAGSVMTTTRKATTKKQSRSGRVDESQDIVASDSPDPELDSDALDEESEPTPKRKRPAKQKGRRSRKKAKKAESEEEDQSDDVSDSADVQVVGKLVKAPTTGRGAYGPHASTLACSS